MAQDLRQLRGAELTRSPSAVAVGRQAHAVRHRTSRGGITAPKCAAVANSCRLAIPPRGGALDDLNLAHALVLHRPWRIRRVLTALHRAGTIRVMPTAWQVVCGVLYMIARVVLRPETVGQSSVDPARTTPRSRLLAIRAVRAPVLLFTGCIVPWDLTGFGTAPATLRRHLLGAYHPWDNAMYDLAVLSVYPGETARLREDVAAVVAGTHPRAAWLRDLVVYEGYHERLLTVVDRALAGDLRVRDAPSPPSDATVSGWADFVTSLPPTLSEALGAWRAGSFRLSP